ncbi:MAG: hypothetical protein P0Y65_04590 [Candidatus Devosia phytovorans]|uniref:Uncharacterized protein n=1 Tax=Candidatus Devosia phytovorans TaxID=3121372 RepID=A0AAJ6B0B7_9HYPH|nr:hypothetical protein [Devosia sp.]WEK05540.1 MAG: hypothetical protein P0Y65_04590 [Devosia sp.]
MMDLNFLVALAIIPVGSLIVGIAAYLMARGDEAQAKAERLRQNHS